MPSLSILNYNSFQKPQLANDVPNEYKHERNEYFIRNEMHRFDIIALQEQFTFINPRPINLLDKAIENGFYYFYKHSNPSFISKMLINDGLLILSKYPIVEADGKEFDPCISIDRLIAKGVIWAKIKLPNGAHIHIFNTHLLATYNNLTENEYVLCKIRAITQLIQLREFIQEKLNIFFNKGDIAILCGDFNVDALNNKFNCGKILNYVNINNKLRQILQNESKELKFYEHILGFSNSVFKLDHIFYRDHKYYPITIGNYKLDSKGIKIPLETIITAENERLDQMNLDHIFELIVKNKKDAGKVWIRLGSSKVEEFFVKNHKFTQLSDHYGLSMRIEYLE